LLIEYVHFPPPSRRITSHSRIGSFSWIVQIRRAANSSFRSPRSVPRTRKRRQFVSSWRATSDTFRGLSSDSTRDLDGFGPPRLPGLASGTLPYGSFQVNRRIMWDVSHVNEPRGTHFCTKVTALPIEVIAANCLEGKTAGSWT